MDAEVELREMEAERAGAGAEVGQAAVGHPLAPVGAKQRIEIVEIGEQLAAVRVAVGAEPLPDLDEQRRGTARRRPPRSGTWPITVVDIPHAAPSAVSSAR